MAVCFVFSVMAISCDDEKTSNTWNPVTTESGTTQNNASSDEQTTDTSSTGDVSAETTGTVSSDDSEEANWSQDYK